MRGKYVSPAVDLTAFNCPHCGALAKQFWYSLCADQLKQLPPVWRQHEVENFNYSGIESDRARKDFRQSIEKFASGVPFMGSDANYYGPTLINLWISKCYNCDGLAVWIYDRLIWPESPGDAIPPPNIDLPEDVLADYEEASRVLALSPRSSAALLRQAVQRLCKQLGKPGKSIDADIAALVKDGLDQRVQMALDIVRVIGNNAVHPGQIDLKDDRPTAEKLFGLVNLIADIMISQPKHVAAMFDGLPEGARAAIEKRDGPKLLVPPATPDDDPT